MTSAIASPLQELLAALTGATDDSDQVCGPSEPGQALGLDGELEVFIFHLEHVRALIDAVHLPPTSAVVTLGRVHDEAVGVRTMTAADATLSAAGYELLGRRIRNGAEALRAVAVPLVATARLALASLYPPVVAAGLTQRAFTIMKTYAAAVAEAWAAGRPANSAKLTAADEMLQRFPTDVLVGYFHGGLDGTIASIKDQRDTLKLLCAQQPAATQLPSYADVIIDVEIGNEWAAGRILDSDWSALHGLFPLRPEMPPTTQAQQKLAAFLRKLQAYQVTLTGLIVYRELEILIDKLTLPTDLTQDQADLAAALADVHAGFTSGGASFATGAAKLAALVGGQKFHDDIDSALWRLEVTDEIKAGITMVALSAVLLTAATLTAGAAAGVVGAAIGELTTGLVAGAEAWTAIGAFAAEVFVFTVVDRTGKVLLFGPDSVADTSFAGDLLWNAITFGVMRVVHLGFGACFSEATQATFAFWLTRFAVDQMALLTIGRIRTAMDDPKEAGRFPPREMSGARDLINQVVVGIVMELGGMLREPVRPRLGDLAPAVEASDLANLDAAEAAAVDLGTKLDEVGPTAPTDEVVQDLLTKLANVFNLTRDLIMRQPDGTPGRTDALMRLYALRAAVEMRLAKAGALVTLSDGNPPQIAPGGTNVVVAPPEARAAINQILTDQGAPPLTDLTTVEGAGKSATDDGQVTVVVSTDALTGAPPLPGALADLAFLTDLLGTKDNGDPLKLEDVSPMAAGGLLNLAADRPVDGPRSQAAIRRIVLEAEPGQRMAYLEFLSRDEFKQADAFTEADLIWFARAPGMREFGGAYGIELARDIRFKVDQASPRFDRRTLAKVFEVASNELEATGSDAAARQAKLEQMANRTGALWRDLAINGPAFAKAPDPTVADYGIKTNGTRWESKKAEVADWYSDPKWAAQLDKITLIELVMDRANSTTDYSDKLTRAQRRELLKNFIALGRSAGLVSDINGKFGHLNQLLFRPTANRKMVFFSVKEGEPPPKLNAPGSYKPDDWQETTTRYISTEQKANELYDVNMSAADMKALARLHRDKISIGLKNAAGERVGGGFQCVPKDRPTEFNIEYTFEPWSPTGKQMMIDAFSAFGSKVNQVTFGDEVTKITPRSAPDPNLD